MNIKYNKIGHNTYEIIVKENNEKFLRYVVSDCDINEIIKLENTIEKYQHYLNLLGEKIDIKKIGVSMVIPPLSCIIPYLITENIFISTLTGMVSILPSYLLAFPNEEIIKNEKIKVKNKINKEVNFINNVKEVNHFEEIEKKLVLK